MTLIHSQMFAQLKAAGFFPASCDIQAQSPGVDAYGVPNGAWANVAGLTSLACSVHVEPRMQGMRGTEEKLADHTPTTDTRRVVFAGRYDGITVAHRAVIGGTTYDVIAADPDAYGFLTEILVQKVTT
jgi:hypothetical protein